MILETLVATGGTAALDPTMQGSAGREIVSLYVPVLFGVGLVVLLVAWLPLVIKKAPLTLPIVCVGLGVLAFLFTPFAQFTPHPVETPVIIEKATELIVIISLMGAGLKIERRFGWRAWSLPTRLLAIAMPLTIVVLALLGHWLLGLGAAAALLLGACLAPTDPVLAGDVQIETPEESNESEARFALTAEAGLNDALAFPFVHLAVAASLAGFTAATWQSFVLEYVLLKLGVGAVVGVASGLLLGWIVYNLPKGTRLSRTGDGFVALGATLLVYAGTELLHGYGFLAVFLAGLMLRRASRGSEFNQKLHDFADETERLLMMVLLVFFGGMIAGGGIYDGLDWRAVVFAVLTLVVVRPAVGYLSLTGVERPTLERFIIATYGIRGLGSVYYLAYALNHGGFGAGTVLWQTVGLIILLSILMHGITVTPMMRRLDKHLREQRAPKSLAEEVEEAAATA